MQDFLLISGVIMVPSIVLFAYFKLKSIKREQIKNSCGKKECPVGYLRSKDNIKK